MNTITSNSSKQFTPIITRFPSPGSFPCLSDRIAVFIESSKVINVYDFTTGSLEHSFPCHHQIKKIQIDSNRLYALSDNYRIQAWDMLKGNSINLPDTWKKVSHLVFKQNFIVLVNQEEVPNKPLSLLIFNSDNYECLLSIQTSVFKIHNIAFNQVFKDAVLFLSGITTHPNFSRQLGTVMMIEGLPGSEIKTYKKNFDFDASISPPEATLKVDQGFVYQEKSPTSINCVFDAYTYAPVLARKSIKNKDEITLISNLGYTLAVADKAELTMYNVAGEDNSYGDSDGGTEVERELWIRQCDRTKTLGNPITLAKFTDVPLTAMHLFMQQGVKHIAEGYQNGSVIIRNLETKAITATLTPPSNMKKVVSCQSYDSNKLMIHYGEPSIEGIMVIVWDLIKFEPFLQIPREAIKNTSYDSSKDLVKIIFPGNIVIQSQDEVLYYKDVLKA